MVQNLSDPIEDEMPPAPQSLNSDQQAKINFLLERWNGVQGQLKRAEQISQLAVTPAINELRYAGRMLVAAMSNTSPTDENGVPNLDDAIVTANQYITNAEHDISDALVYFYQKKTDDLNARFGAETIRKEFPEYGKLLEHLQQARGLVILSRSKMSERKSNYQDLVKLTDEITDNYFSFMDAEILFGLEIEHYRARIKLWKSVSCVTFTWAAIITLTLILV
ncbi:hypothetical protein [Pararhizobium sp. IMCC21322]|uniref:hypothetical protein n=1 Tax=Pararhizobium sp. IMCC21322 TaxID=3067903 RepID=UPI0027416B3B|nr:hypothetical protein [Pararhizobium sp. IMCC21322]